jgi:alkylhydroperoxidase family enzyme
LSEVADFGGEDFESTKKMRLEPIEKPKSIFLKLAYWFSCRQFGVVLTPMKVIYARKPPLLSLAMKMSKFEEKQTSLPEDLRLFIKTATATLNGCTFCQDIALAQAVRGKIGTEKFTALLRNDDARLSAFTEKERAALAVIKEYDALKKVSDETFAELKKHFSETEIVEILALTAIEHFYNALTIPLEIESDGLRQIAEQRKAN